MVKIKKARTTRTEGNSTKVFEIEYHEFPASEIDAMLKKVNEGGDEVELRKKLIENHLTG